jgi:pyruvate dehydrogenase E1 component alpha subunit
MRPGDVQTNTYRGHGEALALGMEPEVAFAELMGRSSGGSKGLGGSMHLIDTSKGNIGANAIVGAGLPIAVGAAMAFKLRKEPYISLTFFGDGATNIGTFHEALNMAAVWKTPTIFIITNNLYGEYSPLATTTAITRLADRATSYGIPGVQVDGNDLYAVRDVVAEAAARARAGDGPTLIEALTYRHKGHSRTDPATYRPEGELERWLLRDPIDLFARVLGGSGALETAEAERLRDAVRADVRAMVEDVMTWPDPEPEARLEHVWSSS